MAAASEAFVRSCEELEAVVSQSASSGTGSVQDDARMKDLNALIDSTRMIANAHQVWAENLGQDVGDPLNRHLGDIMLTVKARQDKNKARIEGLVTKLHDEEDHSYKLSKKKQRDLVMLQEVRVLLCFLVCPLY
ncbi:hypothetical protein BC830DRAFT_167094 [Chytriomyces sp. MP71]|nr:hypothetical protein BC830DRAFT_167094 [Chytriomyces sp. MP71]